MPIYASDSDDQPATTRRLFSRERPMHAILGGGKGITLTQNTNLNYHCVTILSLNVCHRKTAALVKYQIRYLSKCYA